MNKIVLTGNLTRDIELKQTEAGVSVCRFTVACKRKFQPQETDFVPVVAWKTTAEFVARHFSKGAPMLIVGRLQMRVWEDAKGKHTAAEVVADEIEFFSTVRKEDAPEKTQPWVEVPSEGLPF